MDGRNFNPQYSPSIRQVGMENILVNLKSINFKKTLPQHFFLTIHNKEILAYNIRRNKMLFILLLLYLSSILVVYGWHTTTNNHAALFHAQRETSAPSARTTTRCHASSLSSIENNKTLSSKLLFDDFVEFLLVQQESIIAELEELDGSNQKFCNDAWGVFASSKNNATSGGKTRVLQGGTIIEKGACSLTLIRNGILSEERAATIRERQSSSVSGGSVYHAAALSMVLHSRSPFIPTFRSDVRIFWVETSGEEDGLIWLGGGADLTPYYLNKDDITGFHALYRDLTKPHQPALQQEGYTYESMKRSCDDYFYLPARSEHRGTGGIFFDDLNAFGESVQFVKNVAKAWVPSWTPIVNRHRLADYSEQQKQWQLLRRGRYLEFNLLYDRGVKFGLATANPRVEGVMVSAPPLIAWEYNHEIAPESPEEELLQVLKKPRDWV